MGLTSDDTELGMMLPLRSGLSIAEYQQTLVEEFGEAVFENIPAMLCSERSAEGLGDAVIFSADSNDSGAHFYFDGCESESLLFRLKGVLAREDYKKALIFVELGDFIFMFFSDLKYLFEGRYYFDVPRMIYRRASRRAKRVRLEGAITLRKAGGAEMVGQLHDFSPSGASFYAPRDSYKPGDNVLAEFTIADCGTCETVVTVVRVQEEGAPAGQCLVGIRMSLTRDQKKRAEHLYLCKKAEEIQKRPEYSRNTRIF
ncbi:PilZ domain-containing protein [Acidithiobacillus thiooxidans]|nr:MULTISPECIES: PilZ domain-containing protein [Acidithiobacillus]MBE7566061.1 PilZ domain-containing protein [Acidithiobacillus sp. HP-11]MBU2740357.1 PilZ domain-containing protein [Acidithiobacillus albertensis]MBU2752985.1 PilZ domain-containing protein [Acidithiobacillus thiooxidans]MBU2793024.1 PilZ domain-containing protein [Acidithiobacillus thiooxidans]MBU2811570.1 PilZ domain-containing protein [Acidithiobacillus thiooxidans]